MHQKFKKDLLRIKETLIAALKDVELFFDSSICIRKNMFTSCCAKVSIDAEDFDWTKELYEQIEEEWKLICKPEWHISEWKSCGITEKYCFPATTEYIMVYPKLQNCMTDCMRTVYLTLRIPCRARCKRDTIMVGGDCVYAKKKLDHRDVKHGRKNNSQLLSFPIRQAYAGSNLKAS